MKPEEIAKKYNIDLKKLEKEQEKLAKGLDIKDSIDFSMADKISGIDNSFFENQIISGCVVLGNDLEVLEQEYFSDKVAGSDFCPGSRHVWF